MPTKKQILLVLAPLTWLCWFYFLSSTLVTPDITLLKWIPPQKTSFMKDDTHAKISNTWVPLEKISPYLKRAVIAAEDDQFYIHQGVDVEAVKKAAKIDWKKRRFAKGASTITMQLARNLYLSQHKTVMRKSKELLIALKLERELSKERILELYLNVAEWGDGIYGAEAAAKHYFGKSAASLGKYESAFMAAILPNPDFYDHHRGGPYLNKRIATIEGRLY